MVRVVIKLFLIALGVTLGMIVMGVVMGSFPRYKEVIGAGAVICFVVVFSFAFRGSVSQAKEVLEKWAAENGYKVVKSAVLPGRFGWAVFTVEVVDSQGQRRKGYGYCRDIYSSETFRVNWRS